MPPGFPLDRGVACGEGAEKLVLGRAIEAREVETISIPAAADGGMIGDATVQLDGELASALAVPDVGPVVLATGVVQEGEGFDDGAVGVGGEPREGEAVGSDAEPVSRAVDAVGVELILGKDVLGDGDRIRCHAFVE